MDLLDEKILNELFINSRDSNSKMGKKVNSSKEVVNYRIQKLVEKGIISGFIPVINLSVIGYTTYRIQFKLKKCKKNDFLEFLKKYTQIHWIVELNGNWDIVALFWIQNNKEFFDIYDEINENFGEIIEEKRFTIVKTIHNLSNNFLEKKYMSIVHVINVKEKTFEINDLQRNILNVLIENAKISIVDICEKVNSSATNVIYHIDKMIKEGLIQTFIPIINYSNLGYEFVKVTLELVNPSLKKQLIKELYKKKNVIYITESYGKYDLEFEYIAKHINDLFGLINELNIKFEIKNYELIFNEKEHIVNKLPKK